jgi:hypothetical protein
MNRPKITALENRLARERSRQTTRAGRTDRRRHRTKLAIGQQLEDEIRAACPEADARTVACIAAGLAQELGERLSDDPALVDKLHARGRARIDRESETS